MTVFRDHYGNGRALDALQSELNYLLQGYEKYLEGEGVKGDIKRLRQWLEAYAEGSKEAATYLEENGYQILENIHSKLKLAAEEIERIDSESPIAENFTGGKAHRLNKAATVISDAKVKIHQALTE